MSTESVRQLYMAGQRCWPQLTLAYEAFVLHCERVRGQEDSDATQREAGDLYLCCACAGTQPEAMRAFESEVLGVAKAAITRIDRDPGFVQDTLQEVWDKLLTGPQAKVKQYSGRGPLKAWVRVSATRLALDRCRSRGSLARRQVELSDALALDEQSAEARLTKRRFGAAFQAALRDAVAALPTQQRNVLRMHLTGRCNIDEIGLAYNVHRATAARWLERARAQIYDAVRADLGQRVAVLTESEFKSLARMMDGELELSLTSVSSRSSVAYHGAKD
ncbi:MAG: sigma-70 family RNA polymerase sigma factor [Polyangiaceae bacterium]